MGWGHNDSNLQQLNGQGTGGEIKGFTSQQPNTEKFCYRYAGNPLRTLFYKSNDCSPKWGWNHNDPNVQQLNGQGAGGEVWLYTSEQPNTEKYCYRYADNPTRTLFYKSNDCSSKWGWNHNDSNVQQLNGQGAGGEVWVPKS